MPDHPNKEIAAAVRYATDRSWTLRLTRGHAWGRLFCPGGSRGDCRLSVWSTPRDPENHAKQIRRQVDRCAHGYA